MRKYFQLPGTVFVLVMLALVFFSPQTMLAGSAAKIDRDARSALQLLYDTNPGAKDLSKKARSIMVFPDIVKGGFMLGGQYGEGALFEGNKTVGYYKTVEVSYGLQAGAQKYGYAMFFMNESAVEHLEKSSGWEVGTGPTVVIVDEGLSKSISTTTLKDDVYVFFFDQSGLMAGLGLKGTKISKFNPDK